MQQANEVIGIEDDDWDETAPSGVQSVASTNETPTTPKARNRRQKRDWTGFEVIKVYLKPSLHDQLNARTKLDRTQQSDVVADALAAYLKAQPKVDELLGMLLKRALPHELYVGVDALRSAARTTWVETVRGALARASQAPAPEPKLGAPRREPTTIVGSSKVTEGFGGLVSITDNS